MSNIQNSHHHPLLTIDQIRSIETLALKQLPSLTLMTRAATVIANFLLTHIHSTDSIIFLAGPGNNGGDACLAAYLLKQHRHDPIEIWLCAASDKLPEDAKHAFNLAKQANIKITELTSIEVLSRQNNDHEITPAWIVDGLFGIGLQRPIEGIYGSLIDWANTQKKLGSRILSIDIPSGLSANTGQIVSRDIKNEEKLGNAISADTTLTFIADKVGLHTGSAKDYAGEVIVSNLEIDLRQFPIDGSPSELLSPTVFIENIPKRKQASHKGTFGDLGIIGGSAGMLGAPLLAGRASLHAGAGRVLVGFIAENFPQVDQQQIELMLHAAQALPFDKFQTILIGPGLGQSYAALKLLKQVLKLPCPCVLDADALNLIALYADCFLLMQQRAPNTTVLTPHPLEAARLLQMTAQQIQADRLSAAAKLAQLSKAIVVLKGSGTIIQNAEQSYINPTGNAALATAGTGDVLAGTIAALLAQGMDAQLAACAAVYLHGLAADKLVQAGCGPIGVTAGELAPYIRKELNAL